jgi:peptide/nickel transport system ATP-binding protein
MMATTRGLGEERSACGQDALLVLDHVSIAFWRGRKRVEVVESADLTVGRGQTVGLVGESGSGKTVTSLAALGLLGLKGGRVTGGRIEFDGRDVTNATEAQWRALRGAHIGMVFQQPMRSLNPSLSVGEQIAEVVRRHRGLDRRQAWQRAVELLDRVHVADAARRAHDYPHQFSGGMCQRVSIAIAIACEPRLIIADEPTTALDVTVQRRILDLFGELTAETGVSLLYISHDLAVVADICDQVTVMYAGQTVESGLVDELFDRPRHPYTAGLIASVPRPEATALSAIAGRVPPPDAMPDGCRFHPRCPHGRPGVCDERPIPLVAIERGIVRCARQHQLDLNGWTGG